jgi:DDE superfamily endonuclease
MFREKCESRVRSNVNGNWKALWEESTVAILNLSIQKRSIYNFTSSYLRRHDAFGSPSRSSWQPNFQEFSFLKRRRAKCWKFFGPREDMLGDKAYPIERWCIPTFVHRERLTGSHEKFNKIHASFRSVIERSSWFSIFKIKFLLVYL